jgi:hypothetical protein
MVGPDGHFVPMSTYIGSNEERVLMIGRRLGLTDTQILNQGFFAGTMFVARVSGLVPLMELAFSDDEFELETGQIDGTFAHAMERGFSLSVLTAGQRSATVGRLKADAVVNGRYGFA